MSGYVFWCTPCGKNHAGECPPKKTFPKGFTIELKKQPPTPLINTLWIEENFLDGAWSSRWKGNYPTVWKVWKTFTDAEGLKVSMTNGHHDCDIPIDAFSDDGTQGPATMYRMRPYP